MAGPAVGGAEQGSYTRGPSLSVGDVSCCLSCCLGYPTVRFRAYVSKISSMRLRYCASRFPSERCPEVQIELDKASAGVIGGSVQSSGRTKSRQLSVALCGSLGSFALMIRGDSPPSPPSSNASATSSCNHASATPQLW